MKKLMSLTLAVITVLTLVSCGLGKTEVSRGVIEGDVYKSEFIGIEFTKPESWIYSTDEEIAEALNMGADFLVEDKFKEAIENSDSVYDMMVKDSITGTNINVGVENLARTLSTNATEKQYLDALKSQLSEVSSMEVIFPEEYDSAKLGDTEFTRAICEAKVMGVTMTQAHYVRKVDGYMCYVVVTVVKGYTVEDIEAMFG